jgi:antitoxin component YwqK of YwqJK toxin-antitoxin module
MLKKSFSLIKLFSYIILLNSCTSENNQVKCSSLEKNGITYIIDGKPYSGECLTFYSESDNINEKRVIKSGIHKKTIGYYETGELKFTGNMKNDSVNGAYKEYYKSGNLAIQGKFKKGFYEGRWKFLNEDGLLLRITKFKKGQIVTEMNKN